MIRVLAVDGFGKSFLKSFSKCFGKCFGTVEVFAGEVVPS